jgi:hypothetical protein
VAVVRRGLVLLVRVGDEIRQIEQEVAETEHTNTQDQPTQETMCGKASRHATGQSNEHHRR